MIQFKLFLSNRYPEGTDFVLSELRKIFGKEEIMVVEDEKVNILKIYFETDQFIPTRDLFEVIWTTNSTAVGKYYGKFQDKFYYGSWSMYIDNFVDYEEMSKKQGETFAECMFRIFLPSAL